MPRLIIKLWNKITKKTETKPIHTLPPHLRIRTIEIKIIPKGGKR
jgi:hypothetical protein